MKAITRLILRRVVSGNVKLTPRLLQVLKELDQDQSDANKPGDHGTEPKTKNLGRDELRTLCEAQLSKNECDSLR